MLRRLFGTLAGGAKAVAREERFRQIAEEKEKRLQKAGSYQPDPKVSFVIQSFNHRDNIPLYVERLRQLPTQEIVVCEDGSSDGSLEEWVLRLDGPNDFVIRSNDLHEIRAYDRAMRLARGELVCLMQDDEVPPADPRWLADALSLFEQFPDLVVLGGYLAFRGIESQNHQPKGPFPGDLTNLYPDPPAHHTSDGIEFMFVEAINVGPVFIRRDRFIEMGGLDFKYAPVGWPGIHFDVELSLRVWDSGGQVGWYTPGFRQLGARGTEDFGHKGKRLSQLVANHGHLVADYTDRMPAIQARVAAANQALAAG